MRLDRIYIDGFKNLHNVEANFDGRRLTTVIIGQNGTGKSNLVEAIADIFAFADVAGGVDGVEGDEIAGAFADALGCLSGSFRGALAYVSGSAADVTAGAAGLGLGRGLRLGWGGGVLVVLGGDALGADGEG